MSQGKDKELNKGLKSHYFKLPNNLPEIMGDAMLLALYVCIVSHADSHNPWQSQLCKEMKVTSKTIRALIKKLADRGFISVHRGLGRRSKTMYVILPMENWL